MKIRKSAALLMLASFIHSFFPPVLMAEDRPTLTGSSSTTTMPDGQPSQMAEATVEAKNLMNQLVLLNQPVARPIERIRFSADPTFGWNYDLELDPDAGTLRVNAGFSSKEGAYDAEKDSAEVVLFDSAQVKVKTRFSFGLKDGKRFVKTFSFDVVFGTKRITQDSGYSADGAIESVSRSLTEGDLRRQSSLYRSGENTWIATYFATDTAKKEVSLYSAQMNGEQVKDVFSVGFDINSFEKKVVSAADRSLVLKWHSGAEITQYVKENGLWTPKTRTLYKSTGAETYIIDGEIQNLFVQKQEVDGLPGYSARYGNLVTGNYFSPIGLILSSAGREPVFVDYPRTDVVDIDGVEYKIELSVDGQMRMTGPQAAFGKSEDLNEDGALNDADVDALQAIADSGRFEVKADMNRDGSVDGLDVRILADRYVQYLKAVSVVIEVDPAKGDTIASVQARVREMISAGMTKDVNVLIKEGTYYDTHLVLDDRDSGRDGFNVIYRGYPGQAKPRLIGGSLLDSSQWVAAPEMGDNVYKMNIAGNVPAGFKLDVLYVDGQAINNATSADAHGLRGVAGPPMKSTIRQFYPTATVRVEPDWTTSFIAARTMIPGQDQPAHEEYYPIKVVYEKSGSVILRTTVSLYSFDGIEKLSEQVYEGQKTAAEVLAMHPQVKPHTVNDRNQFVLHADFKSFDPKNAEIYFWTNGFVLSKMKVLGYDPTTRVVTLEKGLYGANTLLLQADGTYLMQYPDDKRIEIVNSATYLSENEFLYDGNGTVYVKVASGVDIRAKKVVLPKEKQVVLAEGTIDKPVRNVVLDRLDISGGAAINHYVFSHLDLTFYDAPPEYSAVFLKHSENVTVSNSHIHHTGAAGITMAGVSRGNVVTGNEVSFTGSDGIVLNGDDPPANIQAINVNYRPRLLSEKNKITYNRVHHTGRVYRDADGIHLVQTADNDVSHNTIYHVGYNGIFMCGLQQLTMGWRAFRSSRPPAGYKNEDWNYLRDNRVSHNDISDIMTMGNDGGAIYTHSSGYNNEISHNTIHDLLTGPNSHRNMALFGIYLDGGSSSYFKIHHNLVRITDPESVAVTINGSHNDFTNNTLISTQPNHLIQILTGDRVEGNNRVLKNVFYSSHPQHWSLAIYMMYDGRRWSPGMPIPDGGFVLNSTKTETGSPDNYWSFVPKPTITESEDNVYYTAGGGGTHSTYGVITNWNGWAGQWVNGKFELVMYRVSVDKWRTNPGPGLPAGFDLRSTFTVIPDFMDPANGDYRLKINPLGAGI